jgi:kynurenine formamidase
VAGKPAKTIDEIPLEWCYGDGVVIDVRHRKAGEYITLDDIKKEVRMPEYASFASQDRMPTNVDAAYKALSRK